MNYYLRLLFILLSSFVLFACQTEVPVLPTGTSAPVTVETTSAPELPTPVAAPTSTQVPLAALVNNAAITLADFQAELARYEASGQVIGEVESQRVLDLLIDELLLAQSAYQNGFQMDEAALQQRIDQLVSEAGGQQSFQDWMTSNLYNDQTFRSLLTRAAAAAWMRDQIAAAVPETGEQVHVRQIISTSETQAIQTLTQIQNGANFATLAARQDPVTAGDLGWFPRGVLSEPALEDAVFALQPGEVSGVVETRLGFHILQVIEREPQHPLDAEARFVLQAEAVRSWLDNARSQSDTQIFFP
jgi:peptidyl-prolyl cis-trans isomerase C